MSLNDDAVARFLGRGGSTVVDELMTLLVTLYRQRLSQTVAFLY